ncbi:MAG: TrbI/VirB10 family protein [Snowella sp.]
MTQYSIHQKNSSDSLSSINPQTVDTDEPDWESKMAKLVGLTQDYPLDHTEIADKPWGKIPTPSQPLESPTEEPLSANPFAKLGLVGMGTLSIIVVAGAFLSQMMNSGYQTPTNNPIATEVPAETKNDTAALSTEIESLKTKLALSDQTEGIKAAQQALRQNRRISSTSLPQTQAQTTVQTVYVPRIVTVERVVKVPQPPIIVRQPSTPIKPKKEQLSSKIATLDKNHQKVVEAPQPTMPPVFKPVVSPPIAQPTTPAIPQQTVENPVSSPVPQPSIKPVAAGNSVRAVLATAIFGETMMSNSGDPNQEGKNIFVVRLQEPLKTVDGAIALPENTELLAEIRSLSEQGLLQLDVKKFILSVNNNSTEITLPKNAITVRAIEGKPLIASQFPNQVSSITSMDAGLFILGGLGKAAELFNRTESQVVTTSQAGSIVSNNNPQRNILAGVMEGGMSSVVPQIAQRNQQAIAQMMQRTNIWFLPAGTEVEVYINQLLQL